MQVQSRVGAHERVIRPAAIIPERAARQMLGWLEEHDVSGDGCWAHEAAYVKRFSGPFNGPSGMRGTSVLLGSIHLTWDKYEATIYRVNITDEGAARGMTVEGLCDEVLRPVGLSLASCPKAHLVDAPVPDPFRRGGIPAPSPATP